jgi:tetratricopeptide (TPR) repeat protein
MSETAVQIPPEQVGSSRKTELVLLMALVLIFPLFDGSSNYIGLALSGLFLWAIVCAAVCRYLLSGRKRLAFSLFELCGIAVLAGASISALTAVFPPGAWQAVGGLLLLGLGYRVARTAAEAKSYKTAIAAALLAAALVQSLIALHQLMFTGWYAETMPDFFKEVMQFNTRGGRLRVMGTFVNPNSLAAFLNMSFGVAFAMLLFGKLKVWLRVAVGALGGLFLAVIVLTGSKGGMAAAFIIAAALLALRGRVYLALVLAVLILLIAVPNPIRDQYVSAVTSDPYLIMRVHIWGASLRMSADHPVLGVGPGCFRHVSHRYEPPTDMFLARYSHKPGIAHNSYLHALDETGLVGFLPLALIILIVIVGISTAALSERRRKDRDPYLLGFGAAVLAIMIHSLVDNIAHSRCLLGTALFLFAPLAAYCARECSMPFSPFQRRFSLPLSLPLSAVPVLILFILLLAFAVVQLASPFYYEWRLEQIEDWKTAAVNAVREREAGNSQRPGVGAAQDAGTGKSVVSGDIRDARLNVLHGYADRLRELASIYPRHEAVRRRLGEAYRDLFRATRDFQYFNEAVAEFEAAEANMPRRGFSPMLLLSMHIDLARLNYHKVDDSGELLETMESLARKAGRDWPTRAAYYQVAASVSRLRGEPGPAAERLQKAIALEPNYRQAIFDLYMVSSDLKNEELKTEAVKLYWEAEARINAGPPPDPDDTYARQILAPSLPTYLSFCLPRLFIL